MGTKERRGREKERRKADILDAARKYFWTKGFESSTIPAIAKELELAPGTLYLYFPSKEAIYIELLLEGYDVLLKRLRKVVDSPSAAVESKAEGIIDAFLGFAKDTPEYFDIIFFVLQKEFGGVRKSGLEKGQLDRLSQKENECKKTGLGSPQGIARRAGNGRGVVASWRGGDLEHARWCRVLLARRPRGEFQAVTGAAKEIILSHLGVR